MIGSARRVTTLVRHNTVLRVRDPGHLVSYLVMPMLLMLVFSPVHRAALPEGGQEQAVLGMLVMFSVLSLTVVGTALLGERVWRTWNRLRATPARTAELLLGVCLPVFALLAAQQALLLSFGARFVGMPVEGSPLLLVSAVCVWSFALLAIGCALGSFVRSHGELSAISDVGALAVSVLGGALAPLVLMPSWAHPSPPGTGRWGCSGRPSPGTRPGSCAPRSSCSCSVRPRPCWPVSESREACPSCVVEAHTAPPPCPAGYGGGAVSVQRFLGRISLVTASRL